MDDATIKFEDIVESVSYTGTEENYEQLNLINKIN